LPSLDYWSLRTLTKISEGNTKDHLWWILPSVQSYFYRC